MDRWARPASLVATVVLGVAAAWMVWKTTLSAPGEYVGLDLGHYLDGTRRWLETGTPYLADEVRAPFAYQPLTFLHPPIALALFAPFLAIPALAWYAIPLALIGSVVATSRPPWWAWPVLGIAACSPPFRAALVLGNTDLWVGAFVALGIRFGWPAVLIAIKPSLLPLALVGARRRSWVAALAIVVALCLPFGGLWTEWLAVVLHSPAGVTYSLPGLLWMAMLAFVIVSRPLAAAARAGVLPAWLAYPLARMRPNGDRSLDTSQARIGRSMNGRFWTE